MSMYAFIVGIIFMYFSNKANQNIFYVAKNPINIIGNSLLPTFLKVWGSTKSIPVKKIFLLSVKDFKKEAFFTC